MPLNASSGSSDANGDGDANADSNYLPTIDVFFFFFLLLPSKDLVVYLS